MLGFLPGKRWLRGAAGIVVSLEEPQHEDSGWLMKEACLGAGVDG